MREKRRKELKRRVRNNHRHPDLVEQGLRLDTIVDTGESPYRDKIWDFLRENPEAKNLDIVEVRKIVIQTHYKRLGYARVDVFRYREYMQPYEFAVYVSGHEFI